MAKPEVTVWFISAVFSTCGFGLSQDFGNFLVGSEGGAGICGVDNWTFQLDNDLFADSDRDYTSGVRIAVGGKLNRGEGNGFLRDQLLKFSGDPNSKGYKFFERLSSFEGELEYGWGASLTQFLYTPEDSLQRLAPAGQRPYAAWLGTEFSINVRDENSLSTVSFSIGVTGEWALGEETQDFVHDNISGSPFFNGWDSQLQEEVTANLILNHKRRLRFLDGWEAGNFSLDGYYEFGGAVGTFRTAAHVGGLVRAGWNLTNDYSIPRLQLGAYSNQFFKGSKGNKDLWSVYVFTGVRGSAVVHDITLDGSLFQNWSSSVSSEPFVGEVVVGAGLGIHNFEIVYSKTIRTNEFEEQSDNQEFGSIQLGWRRRF
ncbi:MAG: lipid A deacylase LpxR family protein [Luteolibacter sp.]